MIRDLLIVLAVTIAFGSACFPGPDSTQAPTVTTMATATPSTQPVASSCGTPVVKPIDSSRIAGGIEARPHSWPWQVTMCQGSSPTMCQLHCGGSIVSPNFIVTAAHCACKNHWSSTKKPRQFVCRRTTRALYVGPTDAEGNTNKAVATGWGETIECSWLQSTVHSASEGGQASNVLMQVALPFVTKQQCISAHGADKIDDSMICLGYEEGGKDSCKLDGGGPLVKENDGRFYQYGIVSWGRGCARPRYPGVYTRVSYFCHWIKDVIGHPICSGGNKVTEK